MTIKPASTGFDAEWVSGYLSGSLDEGPLVDRKQELWRVGRAADRQPDPGWLHDRGEFVRHITAMANAARRRNKPAHLVFGFRDKEDGGWYVEEVDETRPLEKQAIGVERQTTRCRDNNKQCITAEEWERLLDEPNQFCKKQAVSIGDLLETAKRYISPPPTIDCDYGWIEFRGLEGFVIYLVVYPSDAGPFSLTTSRDRMNELELIRQHNHHLQNVKPGEYFDRVGDNTIHFTDPNRLVSARQVPYVTRSQWQRYFDRLRARLQRIQPDAAWPLNIRSSNEEMGFQYWALRWLDDVDASQVAVVEADVGSGKTVSVTALALGLIDENTSRLSTDLRDDAPSRWVPVYVPLRGIGSLEELRSAVAAAIDIDGVLALDAERALGLLRDPDLQFVVLLDGADEMAREARRSAVLQRLVKEFAVKYLITSRPRTLGLGGEYWKLLAPESSVLLPVDRHQLGPSIANSDDVIIQEILSGFEPGEIEKALQTPLYLQHLQSRSTAGQVSNLGRLVEWMMRVLFLHESKELPDPHEARQHRLGIGNIAWNLGLSGCERFTWPQMTEWTNEQTAVWALNAGIFREPEQDEFEFSAKALHWYWCAKALIHCVRTSDKARWDTVLDEPAKWKEVLRVQANLWDGDLSSDPMVGTLGRLPYPWPLVALLERYYASVDRPEAYLASMTQAVVQRDLYWVWRALTDPEPGVRHLALDCIERSEAPQEWTDTIRMALDAWEAEASARSEHVATSLMNRVMEVVGDQVYLGAQMEVQYE